MDIFAERAVYAWRVKCGLPLGRESCVESGLGLREDTFAAGQAAHNIGSKDAYEVIAVRRQICGKIGPTSTQICGKDAADLNLASWENLNSANLGEKCGKTCGKSTSTFSHMRALLELPFGI
jgi:hypothetical protein